MEIDFGRKQTKVWKLNFEQLDSSSTARLIANKGGTRSGKTYSLISLFVWYASRGTKKQRHIDVVSESFPHLNRGAIKDMEDNLEGWGLIENVHYTVNRSEHIYEFVSTGTTIRFFAADDWGKVKGSRRDILYINEANRIEWEIYRQLSVRTTEKIFIDWNPDSQFWYELRGLSTREDTVEIHSTYLDNPFLSEMQIAEIESNKNDENWWRVYGLGQTGHSEAIVYKKWDIVQGIPSYARLVGYGLDFGYMNDPTAIVGVYYADGELYADERCYMPGMTNDKIAKELRTCTGPIVADSAEMKSIQEIKNEGIRNIEPAEKGPDSIRNGIDILNRYVMHITSHSTNLIFEIRNYKYKENRMTGEITNEPVDKNNHLLDALRYVAMNKLRTSARCGSVNVKISRID